MVQGPSNEHPSKRQHLTPRDNDNMGWVRREISGIKETPEEMASEAREDREKLSVCSKSSILLELKRVLTR